MYRLALFCLLSILCLSRETTFSAEEKFAPVDHALHTVVIIYGAYRTFNQTCDSIANRIVDRNHLVDIILTVDATDVPTKFVHRCLGEYHKLHIINSPIDPPPRGVFQDMKEFILKQRAYDWIDKNGLHYAFAIEVRTDNYVKVDIDVAGIFGRHSSFFPRFLAYEEVTMKEYHLKYNKTLSFHDLLWYYILTGGIPEYNDAMIYHPQQPQYNFLNSSIWAHDVREYIRTLPIVEKTIYQHYRYLIHRHIGSIHDKFTLIYLIGNTWIHFGKYSHVRDINSYVVANYSLLRWNITRNPAYPSGSIQSLVTPSHYTWPINPFSGSVNDQKEMFLKDDWAHVAESQLRLTHWKLNYYLIDIYNHRDLLESFVPYDDASLLGEIENPSIVIWILRDCHKNRWRLECWKYPHLAHFDDITNPTLAFD